ncbi:hypothetical protein MMC07_008351 [Pseudocyphellaria aurata]|nr:hypothetical protein [Pseudocyphellaria aurata]
MAQMQLSYKHKRVGKASRRKAKEYRQDLWLATSYPTQQLPVPKVASLWTPAPSRLRQRCEKSAPEESDNSPKGK